MNRIDKTRIPNIDRSCFLVNLPKFGRKICSNDHAVCFWDKSNGVLRHGVQRTTHHTLTSACLHEGLAARRNQTKIPIFVNLLSANIGHKNQQNNVSTHIQQQPRGCNCYNKSYYLFKMFLRQNAIAKWKNKDTKLYVGSGVVSCNNQSPSQLESVAEIYNKTGNKIQWIGRT